MNRKEINTISVLIVIVLILILLQKKLKVNNSILDFLLICAIIITGRKYLKVAILLTFLLFIIKTNNSKLNEGFIDTIDGDTADDDDDKDTDDKDTDDDTDDDKDTDDDDDEPEKKATDEDTEPENKTSEDADKPEQDIGTLYEDDCKKKCKKSNKSDSECREICSVICPNPIKYNHDLKELNKLKRIMKELENQ